MRKTASKLLLVVAFIMAILPMGQISAYAATNSDLVTIVLSKSSYVYDGSVKKPSVTVKDSHNKTIPSKYYTVSYASGRKDVGVYSVKVTYKADKRIYKTTSFKIVPKATTITKVTPTSRVVTVSWKRQTTQTTGYQMQYSTKSDFSNAKTITISQKDVTSAAFSTSANKTYYVRVRTYKMVNSKNVASAWTATKTVKTPAA